MRNVNHLVDVLTKRLDRDKKYLAHCNEVYSYVFNKQRSDNLISLPTVTKDMHVKCFEGLISRFTPEERERYKGLKIQHIATWNKKSNKFIPHRPRTILEVNNV